MRSGTTWPDVLTTLRNGVRMVFLPLGGSVMLYLLQDRLLFNPGRTPAVTSACGPDHRKRAVTLRMRDGTKLRGWWMRPDRQAPSAAPAIIYFGGRSEEVSWVAPYAAALSGMHVLFVNYRGYGNSDGHPSERALFSDALELYDWLGSQPGVHAERMAVIGRSLGSGVAAYVAARRRVAAAVLMTPYDSILEIARRRYPWAPVRLLLRHRFEAVRFAGTTRSPVLVLLAEHDEVIPYEHTLRLINAWAGEKQVLVIPGSDHCDIQEKLRSWSAVREFLRARLAPRSANVCVSAIADGGRAPDRTPHDRSEARLQPPAVAE